MPMPLWPWLAGFAVAWSVLGILKIKRVALHPGVFIGLVGGVALFATAFPPDTIPTRLAVVGFGCIFMLGEILVIYHDRAKWEAKSTADNAGHDKRFQDTMAQFAELSRAVRIGNDARFELGKAVTVLSASSHANLRTRTWDLVRRLANILADYRTKLVGDSYLEESSALGFGALGLASLSTYSAALEPEGARIAREVNAKSDLLAAYAREFQVEVLSITQEYEALGKVNKELNAILLKTVGVQDVDEIRQVTQGLAALARTLDVNAVG